MTPEITSGRSVHVGLSASMLQLDSMARRVRDMFCEIVLEPHALADDQGWPLKHSLCCDADDQRVVS